MQTVAVNTQLQQSYTQIAAKNPQIYAKGFGFPKVAESELASAVEIFK
jgi:NAD(P)H-quinone oxidoreductase subunit 4